MDEVVDEMESGSTRRELSRRDALRIGAFGSLALGAGALVQEGSARAVAASQTRKKAAAGRRGGTLRAGLSGGGSADTINPFIVVTNVDAARNYQLYEPLMRLDSDARNELMLAEEVAPNANGTQWTIRIKPGVSFHNGKSMTADDVIYSIQAILNPNSPGSAAPSLAPIDTSTLVKLDNRTIRFSCKTPFANLPDVLASYRHPVVPADFDIAHPVGAGPFKFQSFSPGVASTFIRFDNYWGQSPLVDEVVITDVTDETAQVDALAGGQVDVINLLSSTGGAALRAQGLGVVVSRGGGATPFTMRVDVPPFHDPRVRMAMRLIPDRRQMLEHIFEGQGHIGNDLFSLWDPAYDAALPQRQQDLAHAKHLLAAAGYRNGLSVDLVTADLSQGVTAAAQVFAQQATGAGVKVNLRTVTVGDFYGKNYLTYTFAQDFFSYYPYLATVSLATLPNASFNETHFNDQRYTALYNEAVGTVDEASRRKLIHDMQQIEYEQGGYIIPYFPPVIDGHAKNVKGVIPSKTGASFNSFDFKSMWLS
jgi:peptide/nickel transport system substrate-binding protein